MMDVPPTVVSGDGNEGLHLLLLSGDGHAQEAKENPFARTDPDTEESWIVIPEEDPEMVLEEDFVIELGEQRLEILSEESETMAVKEEPRIEVAMEEDLRAETPVLKQSRALTDPEDELMKVNLYEKSWVMPPTEELRETMASTEEWQEPMTHAAGQLPNVESAEESPVIVLEEDLRALSLAGKVSKSEISAEENSVAAYGELHNTTRNKNDSQNETASEENSVTDDPSEEGSSALTPTEKVSEISTMENAATTNLFKELRATYLPKSKIPAEENSVTFEVHSTTPTRNDPQTLIPAEDELTTATPAKEDTKVLNKAEGNSTKVTLAEEKIHIIQSAECNPATVGHGAASLATHDDLQPRTPDHTPKLNPTAQLLLATSRSEEQIAHDFVDTLVGAGADPEVTSTEAEEEGLRPLHLACWGGNTTMVKQLLHIGADPTALARGRQPVHWAAYGGHVGALEALAAVGVSVNMRAAEDASTPLHLAAENGNAAAVRWLVECGVSVLSKRRDGARALKLAGEAGHRELQAYVRRRGKAEQLLTAAAMGDTQAVRQLLAGGAEVNDCSYNERTRGWSALHFAAEGDKLATVEMLLEAGANVEARAFDGLTAIHVAARSGSLRVLQVLMPIVPDHIMNDLELGLVHAAAEGGDVSILRHLHSLGCDIHAKNIPGGQTTLHVATRFGRLQATKWLLQQGVSAEERDAAELTALDYAWTAKHKDVLIAIAFH